MRNRDSSFRDEFQALLGGPKERRRVMREIRQLEAEELRRMHGGGGGDASQSHPQGDGDGYDSAYLTQPAALQGLTAGDRGGAGGLSAVETLYGRPTSAYSRGTSPSLLLSSMEEELDPAKRHERMLTQRAHSTTLSVPRNPPAKVFDTFMKAPSAMRRRGLRSPDVLFEPGASDNGVFWIYDRHRVSQSTLGSAAGSMAYASVGAPSQTLDEAAFVKLPVWASIKRKINAMIAQGAQQERYGIVFDIVSTGKILAKGIPHMAGKLIYEYVEECRHEEGSNKLKFIFVGITDNINCCTARDVFCLDDRVGGVYVGDYKRPFRAIDNVHMFAVLPPTTSRFYNQVLHASEPGFAGTYGAGAVPPVTTASLVAELSRGGSSAGGRRLLTPVPSPNRRAGSASLAARGGPKDLPPLPARRSATPSVGTRRL